MIRDSAKDLLRRSSRVIFILFWDFILFLIASNIQAGWLYVVIALFIMLAVISVLYPIAMLRGIDARISLQDYTERDAGTSGTLHVKNNSRKKKYAIRIETERGAGFSFSPEAVFIVEIPPQEEISVSVTYKCEKRGRCGPGALNLTCGAPAAIFYAKRKVESSASTLVYPRMSNKENEERAREFSMYDPGPLQKNLALQDPYHYNLREYTPGDSLRSIHWKMTARIGEPVIRVFERKIFGQASIVVDNRRSSWQVSLEPEFEKMLEQALSHARHLLFSAGYTVTVAGTAAPAITIENEAAWERALYWFSVIDLREQGAWQADSDAPEYDVDLFFGSDGIKKMEKTKGPGV